MLRGDNFAFHQCAFGFLQGTQENAEVLSGLVGGHEVVTELFAYMHFLGIQGMGLVQATERSPIVGHIIGALWELHDLVQSAKGNWANCQQLDAYGQDILRVFDAEGGFCRPAREAVAYVVLKDGNICR